MSQRKIVPNEAVFGLFEPQEEQVSALVLLLAFVSGLASRAVGYPPLLGYLLVGFVCGAWSIGSAQQLQPFADFGITMLLFTIGLKLRVGALIKPYVAGPAVLHMLLVIPLTTAVIMLVGLFYAPLAFDSLVAPWTLAFALSFSSTVFAIKIFDERGEHNSFHSAIAIGVLVIQDVFAVAYLVVASGDIPSPWFLLVLLLPFLHRIWSPLLSRLLVQSGHGELQILLGVMLALGAYELFELLHLKGGLGALLIGAMLGHADASRSTELYGRLVNLKNLFLIAFFLQIGYFGFPSLSLLLVAVGLTVLLALRPLVYFTLFTALRLRARTAVLAGIGLSTYSEFGLIVAAMAESEGLISGEWLVTIALAIALSFVVSTPVNQAIHTLYRKYSRQLRLHEKKRLPEEEIEQLGAADIAVLGMGRVGSGAYQGLLQHYGDRVVGIEENYDRSLKLCEQGFNVVHGDASDRDFWEQTALRNRKMILVSLSNFRENLLVVSIARELGYDRPLAVTARYEDERRKLEQLGCIAFDVYTDVGLGFAEYVMSSDTFNDVLSVKTRSKEPLDSDH